MPRVGLTPERVVTAAAGLADADGLDAVTLAALASRLNIRVPSLYKHVDGLGEVRRQVAVRGLRALTDRIAAAAAGLSGDEALRATCAAYRRFAREHPGQYAAIQRAPDPRDDELADRLVELILDVLRGYRLDGDEAVHAVRIVRSTLHGFVSLENGGGFGLPLDTDDTFARLVDLLDAGLGSLPREGPA